MELNDLYSSLNILRVIKSRMGWARNVASLGKGRCVYRDFMGKSEGNRPLGRRRCTFEDNIKVHLHEVGCGGAGWSRLAQNRDRWWALVNGVMNLPV